MVHYAHSLRAVLDAYEDGGAEAMWDGIMPIVKQRGLLKLLGEVRRACKAL